MLLLKQGVWKLHRTMTGRDHGWKRNITYTTITLGKRNIIPQEADTLSVNKIIITVSKLLDRGCFCSCLTLEMLGRSANIHYWQLQQQLVEIACPSGRESPYKEKIQNARNMLRMRKKSIPGTWVHQNRFQELHRNYADSVIAIAEIVAPQKR